MAKYRFKGTTERVFPYARPAAVVGPGDVIERSENPDPRWFELVVEPPKPTPTPSKRVDEEEA